MKQVIHINQHILKKNRLTGERKPVVTFKRKSGGPATLAHQVAVLDNNGREVCRVVYSPDKPLNCGAVAWVETDLSLVPLDQEGNPCKGKKASSFKPKSAAAARTTSSGSRTTGRCSSATTRRRLANAS